MAFNLPPYAQPNRLLDLASLNDAIGGYGRGMEKAYEGETAREMGKLFAADKPQDAMKYAFTRGAPELGMKTAEFQARQEEIAEKQRERGVLQLAKIYDMIGAEKDPAKQGALHDRLIGADPRIAKAFSGLNLPPEIAKDHMVIGRYVSALAAPYRDPLATRVATAGASENEASARLKDAQAAAAGNKGSGFDSFKDVLKYEQDLREEFTKQPTVKDYGTVRDAYGKVQGASADKSAAGDISMIFAYMKMLDPASTVREGEFATAQNATGIPGRVQNLYNQILSGNRLNDPQRLDFMNQAKRLYGVHERQYGTMRGQYEFLARRAGIDPSRITLDFGKVDEGQQSPYGIGPARPQAQPAPGSVPQFNPPPPAAPVLPPRQPTSPQKQGEAPAQGQIPPNAIRALRANPALAPEFENKYGVRADQYLMDR